MSSANSAVAFLKDEKGITVGVASFTKDAQGLIRFNVVVSGMKPGLHGIHIHEKGICIKPSFTSAGAHYNPLGKEHGLKNLKGPHAGDLPNLEVGSDGEGYLSTSTKPVTLSPGPTQWNSNCLWGHREKIIFFKHLTEKFNKREVIPASTSMRV